MDTRVQVNLYILLPDLLRRGVLNLISTLRQGGFTELTHIALDIKIVWNPKAANLLITESYMETQSKKALQDFVGARIVIGKDCSHYISDAKLLELFHKKLGLGPHAS